MNGWDWFFAAGPFIVLAAVAWWSVRRARKAGL